MRQSSFFKLRHFVNLLFFLVAILLPYITIKIMESDYYLDLVDRLQLWLLIDGVLLLIQTIILRYLNSIPLYPDVLPPAPPKENNKQ